MATQACAYCHEHVVRQFERCTGRSVDEPLAEVKQTFADAKRSRTVYKRPNNKGNVLFPLAGEMRRERPDEVIEWKDVQTAWDQLSPAEQERRGDTLKISRADKKDSQCTNENASTTPLAKTPWGLGSYLPTTAAMTLAFMAHFRTARRGQRLLPFT